MSFLNCGFQVVQNIHSGEWELVDAGGNVIYELLAPEDKTTPQISMNEKTLVVTLINTNQIYMYTFDVQNGFAVILHQTPLCPFLGASLQRTSATPGVGTGLIYSYNAPSNSSKGNSTLLLQNRFNMESAAQLPLETNETVKAITAYGGDIGGVAALSNEALYTTSQFMDAITKANTFTDMDPNSPQLLGCSSDGKATFLYTTTSGINHCKVGFARDSPFYFTVTGTPQSIFGNETSIFVQVKTESQNNIYKVSSSESVKTSAPFGSANFVGMTMCNDILIAITRTDNQFTLYLFNSTTMAALGNPIILQNNDIPVAFNCCNEFLSIETYNVAQSQKHAYVIDMVSHQQVLGAQTPTSPNVPFVSLVCCEDTLTLMTKSDGLEYDLHILSAPTSGFCPSTSAYPYSTSAYDNSCYDTEHLISFIPDNNIPQRLFCNKGATQYVVQTVTETGQNALYFLPEASDGTKGGAIEFGTTSETFITGRIFDRVFIALTVDQNDLLHCYSIDSETGAEIISAEIISGAQLPNAAILLREEWSFNQLLRTYIQVNASKISFDTDISTNISTNISNVSSALNELKADCGAIFASLLNLTDYPPGEPGITGFIPLKDFAAAISTDPTPVSGCTSEQISAALLAAGLSSNTVSGCTDKQSVLWPTLYEQQETVKASVCGTNTYGFITYNAKRQEWRMYNASNTSKIQTPPNVVLYTNNNQPITSNGNVTIETNKDTFTITITPITGGN